MLFIINWSVSSPPSPPTPPFPHCSQLRLPTWRLQVLIVQHTHTHKTQFLSFESRCTIDSYLACVFWEKMNMNLWQYYASSFLLAVENSRQLDPTFRLRTSRLSVVGLLPYYHRQSAEVNIYIFAFTEGTRFTPQPKSTIETGQVLGWGWGRFATLSQDIVCKSGLRQDGPRLAG